MKTQIETVLSLNEQEAQALKKLLGNLTDIQKAEAGLSAAQKRITTELWNAIPDFDNEDYSREVSHEAN